MLWPFFILLIINTVNKCACVIVCRGLLCNGKDNCCLSLFWGVRQNGRYNSQIKNYIFIMIIGFLIQMLQKVKSTCLNTVCFYIVYGIRRNYSNCHDTLLCHSKQLLTVLTVLIQLSSFSFLNNTCTHVLFLALFDSYLLGRSNSYLTQN